MLVSSNDAKPRCAYDCEIVINDSPDQFGPARRVAVRDANGKTYVCDIRKLYLREGDIDDRATYNCYRRNPLTVGCHWADSFVLLNIYAIVFSPYVPVMLFSLY